MTQPRKILLCIDDTPHYHLIYGCFRRSYLWGVDHTADNSYERRRQWIKDRLRILSSLPTIDLCAYCVISNTIHSETLGSQHSSISARKPNRSFVRSI
jgi:hypothetical protein